MIIPDFEIRQWAKNGGIAPYDTECINPASIDLRWSGNVKIAMDNGWHDFGNVDEKIFYPGALYLLDTLEYIKIPPCWAGELMLKSSLGRQGLEHLHAGWFDPGFEGTGTLEIKNMAPWPITLKRGQKIVQMAFHELKALPEKSYQVTGRYNGQRGPTEAKENKK